MCASIARHWRQHLLPDRWWRLLWSTELVEDPGVKSLHAAEVEPPAEVGELPDDDKSIEPEPSILEDDPEAPQPSAQELEKWKAQLHRLHRAAGHPSKRNLVRMTQTLNCLSGRFVQQKTSHAQFVKNFNLVDFLRSRSHRLLCIHFQLRGNRLEWTSQNGQCQLRT